MSNWLTVIEFDFLAEWLKAPAREQHQILEKIKILAQDPLSDGYTKRLLRHQANKVYRLRSGRHRIIYSLEQPYISILALELRDDDTYKKTFTPHPLINIDNFIGQLENIKRLDLDQLEEAFLLALKAEVKQLISQIPKNTLEVEKKKLAEEKDKLEEATSVLALLEDELYQRRQQLNHEKEKIEAEKQVILAEARTWVERKLSEDQRHAASVQPPRSVAVWLPNRMTLFFHCRQQSNSDSELRTALSENPLFICSCWVWAYCLSPSPECCSYVFSWLGVLCLQKDFFGKPKGAKINLIMRFRS